MTFTDDDLKRWKDRRLILRWNDELAIIARLEAAERVCKAIHESQEELMEAEEVWRKVVGK